MGSKGREMKVCTRFSGWWKCPHYCLHIVWSKQLSSPGMLHPTPGEPTYIGLVSETFFTWKMQKDLVFRIVGGDEDFLCLLSLQPP